MTTRNARMRALRPLPWVPISSVSSASTGRGRIDAAGQRRHIWAGIWTRSASGRVKVQLEAGRTRDEVAEWLLAFAKETPRMVVGIDCCFSFPAWFLAELGCADVFSFWRLVNAGAGERWLDTRGRRFTRFTRRGSARYPLLGQAAQAAARLFWGWSAQYVSPHRLRQQDRAGARRRRRRASREDEGHHT